MAEVSIRRILRNVGLTEKEIDLYIFLGKRGPLKGTEIAKQTKIDKAEVYRILKRLQSKGLLQLTLQVPARFVTVPFDKVIDTFVKARRDEASLIENAKQDLMSDWAKISKIVGKLEAERFVILEGDSKIYPKILQFIQEAKSELSFVATVNDLARITQYGLLEVLSEKASNKKIRFRYLTDITELDLKRTNILQKMLVQENFEGKNINLGLPLSPRIVIRDDREILLFITQKEKSGNKTSNETCLWTNCQTLVQSFKRVFDDLWLQSARLERRLREIETGKPTAMVTICDSKVAADKYKESIYNAKEEVFVLTSWESLNDLCRDTSDLQNLAKKSVSIKLMAPIVDPSQIEELVKYGEVRHCAQTALSTTLIDGQHLFQFKNHLPKSGELQPTPFPETIIYTNRVESVQKTRAILNNIWKNAPNASNMLYSAAKAPKLAVGSLWEDSETGRSAYRKWLYHVIEREEGTVTERDIIQKMIHAKRFLAKDPSRDINMQYGSNANAVIHASNRFDLPNMIITAHHENKQSSFGAEDWLTVSLWMETENGFAYVPVVHVTDNSKAVEWRRGVYSGTPASKNSILVLKNQLKVSVQGNTLFAGWTVPIHLLPPKVVLPPACILFEAFGDVRPNVIRSVLPSGRMQTIERNSFKAFVKFFLPNSTYEGPGVDGDFHRERIMTAYPPKSGKH